MAHALVSSFKKAQKLPLGKSIFSRIVCMKAPYFSSIRPTIEVFEPGNVEVSLPKRRAVQNHIGTVHAIAMCNACELAGGMATEITIPKDMRWIPKGMTVKYLKKAETDLRAIAKITSVPKSGSAYELIVPVDVQDSTGQVVMHADITMWVSPKG